MVAYEQIGTQNIRYVSDDAVGACNIRSLLLVQTMYNQSALPLGPEKFNEDPDDFNDYALTWNALLSRIVLKQWSISMTTLSTPSRCPG